MITKELNMVSKFYKIKLDLVGLGIIFYSLKSVEHIKEGERFLMTKYNDAEDVLKYIYNGTLVGFCTCSPGRYILNIHVDDSPLTYITGPDFSLKLCIRVTDNRVFFDDLYALLSWQRDQSEVDSIEIENGIYKVTVDSFFT